MPRVPFTPQYIYGHWIYFYYTSNQMLYSSEDKFKSMASQARLIHYVYII